MRSKTVRTGAILGLAMLSVVAVGGPSAWAADLVPFVPAVAPPPPPPPPPGPPPAVSKINGKIDLGVGWVRIPFGPAPISFPAIRAQGAISFPLGNSFGLQLDGAAIFTGGQTYVTAAEHLFWRNPNVGLAGFYGSWSSLAGTTRWRAAGQAEAYLGPFSLEAIVGVEFGAIPTGIFAITDVAFYPTDNLRLSLGFRHDFFKGNALAAGAEFQFASGPNAGLAAFVDGEFGPTYQQVFGGLRIYFGDDKTLIRRHREDDPRIQSDLVPPCVQITPQSISGRAPIDPYCGVDG